MEVYKIIDYKTHAKDVAIQIRHKISWTRGCLVTHDYACAERHCNAIIELAKELRQYIQLLKDRHVKEEP